jgi:hypothetical protein
MNELIKTFALDTENDYNNINLARYYHSIGHTASAITHYLRCAEITQDELLAYECLLLMSLSFMEQGNRDFTAQLILKQAIVVLPERSEAYLLLCKFLLEKHEYYDCYLFSCIALKMYENNIPLKFHHIDDIYPKLLYFKAHSGIHWEKTQESKDIFQDLYINYFSNFNTDMQTIILGHVENKTYFIFEKEYKDACNQKSDINEHLPMLYSLAQECSSVTEFGVREGNSTKAFLASYIKKLRSYDLLINKDINKLFDLAKIENIDVEYIEKNVLDIDIEQTDMLFIDTWHQYDQLKKELNNHAKNVNKYIVLHDTFTFGIKGENFSGTDHLENPVGVLPALIEFMIENPEWKFKYHTINNNGLIVIQRISQ